MLSFDTTTYNDLSINCRYNLENLSEPRCPEFGRRFDSTDWEKYLEAPDAGDGSFKTDPVLTIVTLPLLLLCFVLMSGI